MRILGPTHDVELCVRARLRAPPANARWVGNDRIAVLEDEAVALVSARDAAMLERRSLEGLEAIALAVRPDGERVAVGGLTGRVTIFDAALAPVADVTLDRPIDDLLFAPNSGVLAVAAGRTVAVYERSGRERFANQLPRAATALAFSRYGHLLAAASGTGVQTWHVADGLLGGGFASAYPLVSVSFAPENRYLVAGAGAIGGATASVWQMPRGSERVLRGFEAKPRSLGWLNDGRLVTSGGPGLILWTLHDGVPELRRAHHGVAVTCVVCARDHDFAVTAAMDGTIAVWAPNVELDALSKIDLGAEPTAVQISPDERTLLVAGGDGELALFRVRNVPVALSADR